MLFPALFLRAVFDVLLVKNLFVYICFRHTQIAVTAARVVTESLLWDCLLYKFAIAVTLESTAN